MSLRVGVVGAGPAGLCAAKHSIDQGLEVVVFEQSGDLGGTWQYTQCVGKDEMGAPVHTSMYRDLRTNVPKDVVMFPGIPHKDTDESYLSSNEILQYLNTYADMFDIRNVCKFYQHVLKVCKVENEWKVTVLDILSSSEHTYTFDAIFICNGVNNKPHIPKIDGASDFKGYTIHSHDYRVPEVFTGQNVLILGGRASGLDLTNHISKCADKHQSPRQTTVSLHPLMYDCYDSFGRAIYTKMRSKISKVFLSHHSKIVNMKGLNLPANVIHKTDIKRLYENSVEFVDGSVEKIDSFVYCTGFKCNYSFLDESCGITEDEGFVYPLYKHFINANHETMCILGNMCHSMQFPTFDIQVRFFIKSLRAKFLPPHDEMLGEIHAYASRKLVDGAPKKAMFDTTAEEDEEYYDELSSMAGIQPLPKVLSKMFARASKQIYENFPLFRLEKYSILDDENFSVAVSS